jgi:peroxiredoxin
MSRSLPVILGALTALVVVAAVALLLPLGSEDAATAWPTPTNGFTTPTPTPPASRATAAATATATPTATALPRVGTEVGNRAPDFSLVAPDGRTVRLSDFRGQPVWINFWAPWCPACRTEMPRIEGMYQEHRADGLVVLGVAVQDSREAVVAFADEVGATYPIVIDADGRVAAEYGALALPVHYWIDRDGIVRDWAFGELPPDLLTASLGRILVP